MGFNSGLTLERGDVGLLDPASRVLSEGSGDSATRVLVFKPSVEMDRWMGFIVGSAVAFGDIIGANGTVGEEGGLLERTEVERGDGRRGDIPTTAGGLR
jgi:hypothetical protein